MDEAVKNGNRHRCTALVGRRCPGRWVSRFNTERFHGELGDFTPAETEEAYYAANPQTHAA